MQVDESQFEEGTNACPRCTAKGRDKSGDNFTYYGKGLGGYCWSCNFTIPSDEHKDDNYNSYDSIKGNSNMIKQKDMDTLKDKALSVQELHSINQKTIPRLRAKWRGLSPEVCESMGVRWEVDVDGKVKAMYYPVHVIDDGEKIITGFKIREMPKQFHSVGYVGKLNNFIGQTDAVEDTLILTAGEVDLLTAIQALETSDKYRKSYNVVSSPLGESSTATFIKINYDWVNSHKKIVVALDDDEAGNQAFEAIKKVLDNSKLFRANMRHKDLGDYLKFGDGDKIANDVYWSPIPTITYGIAGSGSIYNEMLEMATQERIKLPPFLSDLDNIFVGGIGLNEIITVTSPPSLGKTSIVNQWIIDWLMTCRYRIFIVSIEDSAASFGMKIASKILGVNIAGMATVEEKVKVLTENKDKINEYLYTESGENRFDILSKIPSNVEDLKAAILHAIKVHNSRVLIIDPLSAVLASMSNEQQVELMAFFEQIKRDHSCTVILCLHTRKSGSGQKDVSEGAEYGESDIRGSSAIPATATINILLSRNKFAEDEIEKNTTSISVSKNRSQGNTGRNVAKIYYSKEHSTLFSYNYASANNFFKDVTPEGLKEILDNNKATEVVGTDIDDVEIVDCF